jgi:hypothetical protein
MRGVYPEDVATRETINGDRDALQWAGFALHGVPPERPAGGLELKAVRSRGVPLLRGFGGFDGEASG